MGASFASVGVIYIAEAFSLWKKRNELAGLGSTNEGKQLRERVYQVGPIEDKIRILRKLVLDGSHSPAVRATTAKILSRKCGGTWCVPEKNQPAEVKAVFDWVRGNIRYTRDPRYVDQFVSAEKILQLKTSDCDELVVVLGALLLGIGYPVKFRVIQAKGAADWSHIYLLVGLPLNSPKKWIPLDASMAKPAGWEAPDSLKVKQKDFDI